MSDALKRRMVAIRAETSAQRPPRKLAPGESRRVRCKGCRRILGRVGAGERLELICEHCRVVTTAQA